MKLQTGDTMTIYMNSHNNYSYAEKWMRIVWSRTMSTYHDSNNTISSKPNIVTITYQSRKHRKY